MRVYLTSTGDDLTAYRTAAREVTAELGLEAVTAPPSHDAGRDAVALIARRIAHADLVVALVGWRRGEVPGPELGGDGQRSWTEWEVRSAFRQAKPVVVLRADDDWPQERRESDAVARARLADFRGELDRLAVPFAAEPAPRAGFRARLERELNRYLGDQGRPQRPADDHSLRLRRWPPPELPQRPYPLLLPYTHPDLLGGRRRELAELVGLLAEPVPILGLHAASGAGKSSLLGGGLVARLRAEGRPAAFERHPDEPGLAARLLGDLLTPAADLQIADEDRHGFVERLLAAARLAGRPPVLVLDQFEDLLRPGKDRARAVVGTLLAASVQRQPGCRAPTCRWVLAYRREFHGAVCGWLTDVLSEVPGTDLTDASDLPHDLSGPDRFHAWALPTLGTPSPGAEDRGGEATRAFQEAIETPLAWRAPDGTLRYPWRFVGDGAARLARAFGQARLARPGAPLVPELQVLLAHLLAAGGEPEGDEPVEIEVPADPGELVDRALEEHLRRALEAAFPASPRDDARTSRTRAVLALRELAEKQGRRRRGLPAAVLAQAISPPGRSPGGEQVLEKLATPQTRLVVMEEHADGWRYVLSHDRMAELLVRLVDGEEGHAEVGSRAAQRYLGIDAELLDLRRFVSLQSELFEVGESAQATAVPAAHFRRLERHADALLWDEERRRWWAACRRRRRHDRRWAAIRSAIAAAAVGLVALAAWSWADRRARRQALYDEIVEGEPETAFAALAELMAGPDPDREQLLLRLRQRAMPLDVFDRGLGGVGDDERRDAVLRVAELAVALVEEAPEDPVLIASSVWALDFFAAPDPALVQRALALRHAILEPLRRLRPPPPMPGPANPDWVDVPGGTFQMGTGPGEIEDDWARPRHQVTVSGFRMLRHEVTNAEYRRLKPDHQGMGGGVPPCPKGGSRGDPTCRGGEDLPVVGINWYEAYTYAAWLGGRLATEAEWEYVARAGCRYALCNREGREATADEVAWTASNSTDPQTGEAAVRPVMQLEPNPWGLYDVYGNVWEFIADWADPYSAAPQTDPPGPTRSATGNRSLRGFSAVMPAGWLRPAGRAIVDPNWRRDSYGLRVVLPGYLAAPPPRPGPGGEGRIGRPRRPAPA